MLTMNEIEKYANLLDAEYETEIKPILKCGQSAIDEVFSVFHTDKFENARARGKFDNFHLAYLTEEIQSAIKCLGYYEDAFYHTIRRNGVSTNIPTLLGYSYSCYGANDGLMKLFRTADCYKNNMVGMVDEITALKKRFNAIRAAFKSLFDNDWKLFKDMAETVARCYNTVMESDSKKDEELYNLFNERTDTNAIKITVMVEKV